jgi:hypothetical protein
MDNLNHCGALFEHLQSVHHKLNCELIEVRHQFETLPEDQTTGPAVEALIARLERLHRDLLAHYREEEAGGCMEEAIARCPSLGPQSKALMAEHPLLAQSLESLITQIKKRHGTPRTWQQGYDEFVSQVRTHEAEENRIMTYALGAVAADMDVEGLG